ncbi:hypothetical protein BLA29_000096 [Euroglyphus maynei]|uniref:Uncharacterized protein n=1 Tax=Euroglyphus maynei TaxID=6958 RepID=A0A1Y3AR15_EURMA|nr:hypothetical protein BLA29_000096 [Euroglyphus maynei]
MLGLGIGKKWSKLVPGSYTHTHTYHVQCRYSIVCNDRYMLDALKHWIDTDIDDVLVRVSVMGNKHVSCNKKQKQQNHARCKNFTQISQFKKRKKLNKFENPHYHHHHYRYHRCVLFKN